MSPMKSPSRISFILFEVFTALLLVTVVMAVLLLFTAQAGRVVEDIYQYAALVGAHQ